MKTARLRRRHTLAYFLGAGAGLLALIVLLLPGNEHLHARGPMNIGHEDLECADCHRPAPGTYRQQIQANLRFSLGSRAAPVPFGRSDVDNERCLECHERPDDRHPVYRFLEPRFMTVRQDLAPHLCESCHREHADSRVTLADIGFCANCHEATRLRRDPLDKPHDRLIELERWETCLGCHDFHGNHYMRAPQLLAEAFAPEVIREYFGGGPSPYGEVRYPARNTTDDE